MGKWGFFFSVWHRKAVQSLANFDRKLSPFIVTVKTQEFTVWAKRSVFNINSCGANMVCVVEALGNRDIARCTIEVTRL
jgi:hypothetical protein